MVCDCSSLTNHQGPAAGGLVHLASAGSERCRVRLAEGGDLRDDESRGLTASRYTQRPKDSTRRPLEEIGKQVLLPYAPEGLMQLPLHWSFDVQLAPSGNRATQVKVVSQYPFPSQRVLSQDWPTPATSLQTPFEQSEDAQGTEGKSLQALPAGSSAVHLRDDQSQARPSRSAQNTPTAEGEPDKLSLRKTPPVVTVDRQG
jgi:hypothetical protein